MEQIQEMFRKKILERLDLSGDVSDQILMEQIQEQVDGYALEHLMTLEQRQQLQERIFNSFRKLDLLQELIEQPEITEVMVNGTTHIFYEVCGEIRLWDKHFTSREKLDNVVQQIVAQGNKTINEADPIVDTRLSDGSRVNIVLPPVALDGACITIRKFSREMMSMEHLIEIGTLSREMAAFLKLLVQAGYNIFVSGGTGSGKTTFLNALSQWIPRTERVITIEDSAELQLQGVSNLVRLETRTTNVNGVEAISIRDLIRTSLRMRPDRIIVGEVRGAESLDLLQVNNTGHNGSMSTGHGNSCKDMLSRLETMVLMGMDLPLAAVRGQIAAGIDIMVHLGRMRDKSRKVLQICEVSGIKDGEIILHPLYEYVEQQRADGKVSGSWMRVGQLLSIEKIRASGLEDALECICSRRNGKEDQNGIVYCL